MHADAGGAANLEAALATLAAPVRLVFFTQTFGCETCLPARQIVNRVASLSDQISVEEFNIVLDTDQVEAYGIRRVPAIAVVGEADTGIRFYGVPDGHELVSLVESIQLVASGDSGLSDESQALIAAVEQPIDIQVFVTPT
ncbi:MAG: thioredoxin family protein [Acidobacteria bacterium]|nr:thioredoxin family protein [Acidobacteriota bacterium]